MTFRGLVLQFRISDEALKPLVALGYSKPPSRDEIILKRTFDYGTIEVHKRDEQTCMVLCRPNEAVGECVMQLVGAALEDLSKAGLYNDTPF